MHNIGKVYEYNGFLDFLLEYDGMPHFLTNKKSPKNTENSLEKKSSLLAFTLFLASVCIEVAVTIIAH